jgi:hypothetical protein
MNNWVLSKSEYDILLKYIGCGNFPDADIIVFGNEEGTGGYSVEANVKARVNLFGKDTLGQEYKHMIKIDSNNFGFYEPSSLEGRKKVERYLKENEKSQPIGFSKGVFNQSIARICLALEQPNSRDWFKGKDNNEETWEMIKKYVIDELYEERRGIQTALTDWRPLPRENQTVWYEKEYGLIATSKDNNPYLSTFDKPLANSSSVQEFSEYYEDMKKRSDILKLMFEKSKAKVIISIGGCGGFKKDAFELMFGKGIFKPLKFKNANMYNSNGQELKSYYATVALGNKIKNIYLIPFPDPGQVFRTQEDALKMLEELTYEYIKPNILK